MIRHPLIRCGLFVVAVILAFFLFSSARGSFYLRVAMTQVAVFSATAGMLALDRRGPSFIGLSLRPGWWRQLLAGVALGVGMIAIIVAILQIAGSIAWQPQAIKPGELLLLTGLFLLASTGEELLFRGYGFQRLIESVGPAPTLIVLSIFFAAGHYRNPNSSWPGLANTVLVGLVFGLAYLRTGRLWLPIGWHFGWNLAEAGCGFLVSGIRFTGAPLAATVTGSPLWTGGDYGPEASLLATIVLFAGLLLVLPWKNERETESLS